MNNRLELEKLVERLLFVLNNLPFSSYTIKQSEKVVLDTVKEIYNSRAQHFNYFEYSCVTQGYDIFLVLKYRTIHDLVGARMTFRYDLDSDLWEKIKITSNEDLIN